MLVDCINPTTAFNVAGMTTRLTATTPRREVVQTAAAKRTATQNTENGLEKLTRGSSDVSDVTAVHSTADTAIASALRLMGIVRAMRSLRRAPLAPTTKMSSAIVWKTMSF